MHFSNIATLLLTAVASVAAAPVLDTRATGIKVYLSNLGYVYGYPAGSDPSKQYVCSTAAFVSLVLFRFVLFRVDSFLVTQRIHHTLPFFLNTNPNPEQQRQGGKF